MASVPFFARRFVAGADLNQAIAACGPLYQAGIRTSLDILGEDVLSPEESKQALQSYLDLVHMIERGQLNSHISIKLSMLGLKISEDLALGLLRDLVSAAHQKGVFIRIDMEGSHYTSKTIDLFKKTRKDYDNLGIVLQAYLFRTFEDAREISEMGGRIRLCKGAYKEPAHIAYQNMSDIRNHYLKIARMLIKRGSFPAFATHDDSLISGVKAIAHEEKATQDSFEFQMLYGLRRETWLQLVQEGYGMRVYVPFGTKWFPYFSRRLRERKENVFFIVRTMFQS